MMKNEGFISKYQLDKSVKQTQVRLGRAGA
jgi:hypothetical protein